MKALKFMALACATLAVLCTTTFAQNSTLPPDLLRVLLQGKKVYVTTGHVRYYKTKAFVKSELVDSTPYDEPAHKELEKWGRFTIVSDFKQADLIVRVYMSGSPKNEAVMSTASVGGSATGPAASIVLDVLQPKTNKVLWIASKASGLSWSTNSAVGALFKKFREYLEGQETSNPAATIVPTNAPATRPPVVEQPQVVQPPQ